MKGSTSEKIRQRLLAGEGLNGTAVARQYGVSDSLLKVVLGSMKAQGYVFSSFRQDGRVVHRIRHRPEDLQANTASQVPKPAKSQKPVRTAQKAAGAPGAVGTANGAHPPALPALGATGQITALALTSNGPVMVLRTDDGKAWSLQLAEVPPG